MGLKMGKYCQIITKSRPLIYTQNCVLLNIFVTKGWILIKFSVLVYINKILAWMIIFLFLVNLEQSYFP